MIQKLHAIASVFGAASLCIASVVGAESPADRALSYAEHVASGRKAVDRHDWAGAIRDLRRALAISSDDGSVHRLLGRAFFSSKIFREAAAEFEAARRTGFGEPASVDLDIAASWAGAGDRNAALDWVERALADRLKDRARLASDDRLATLRDDPRFRALAGMESSSETDRVKGWTSDLDLLGREIQRLDPRYRERLPEGFSAKLASLKTSLPRLSDQEVVLEAMSLVASLGSAHSVVFPFGMNKGTLRGLPIQLYQFSDGVFIVRAPADLSSGVGAKVTHIGGRPVQELLTAVAPYISRDNEAFLDFASPLALTWPDLLRHTGAAVGAADVEFRLVKNGGPFRIRASIPSTPIDPDKLEMKLGPPTGGGVPPDWLSRPDENFWFKRVSARAVYVQINQCSDSKDLTMAGFADRMAAELDRPGTEALVVDVRRNNGGNENLMFPVVAAILGFERTHPKARIFVAIGRNTLSAAQSFVSTLDLWANATFVGEPSGSRPNHVGDDTLFVLPYSGLMGSLACALHQTQFRDLRQWIAPGLPVTLSSEDYFGQRDPVMETILRSLGSSGVSAAGGH